MRMIWDDPNVHGPFVMEKSDELVMESIRAGAGSGRQRQGCPTVRNTITRLANYILENTAAYVRGDPTLEKVQNVEAAYAQSAKSYCSSGRERKAMRVVC